MRRVALALPLEAEVVQRLTATEWREGMQGQRAPLALLVLVAPAAAVPLVRLEEPAAEGKL